VTITQENDNAVWRDIAAGLTVQQFAQVERMEVIPSPWVGDDLAALLLRQTRECLKRNSQGR